MNEDSVELSEKLNELLSEHEKLNNYIDKLDNNVSHDQIKIQKLKKRKLVIKDEITNLKSKLLPNIIA
tara:strand:- start:1068 stop:1271 length:204 start_codon:yes stop_codon:yes gene_type:complete